MMKSLLAGLAVCAALTAFAGNANAQRAYTSYSTARGSAAHDCVHVAFPQCGGRHTR
jgi:hypothetical protein